MDTEIQTCVKSRITKSNLPITKGKDQVLKFHSHTGLISWQIWMMHCSSHDGGTWGSITHYAILYSSY